jgi:hypothetical protein
MEERLHVLTGRWATFVSENKVLMFVWMVLMFVRMVLMFVRIVALSKQRDSCQALRADIEEERKDHVRHPLITTVNPLPNSLFSCRCGSSAKRCVCKKRHSKQRSG